MTTDKAALERALNDMTPKYTEITLNGQLVIEAAKAHLAALTEPAPVTDAEAQGALESIKNVCRLSSTVNTGLTT